jgi:acetate kinase
MAKLVCQLHGLTGIIFCGPLGNSNPRVRELLCERFSWLGAAISLKSNQDNQTKLHKKSSSCLIFNIKENNERAMLSLFNQRI